MSKSTRLVLVTEQAARGADPLVVERARLYIKRSIAELREWEEYKKKRGLCIAGIMCIETAVEGPMGGRRACPHHAAALKAGIKLTRQEEAYHSAFHLLEKARREQEKKEQAKKEKEKEAKKAAAKKKKRAAA